MNGSRGPQGPVHHHGVLAGVGAGGMGVLVLLVVILLAWHRIAGTVSAGVTVLIYVLIAAVIGVVCAAGWFVFLWVRHRARNPHLLARGTAAVAPAAQEAVVWQATAVPLEPGHPAQLPFDEPAQIEE